MNFLSRKFREGFKRTKLFQDSNLCHKTFVTKWYCFFYVKGSAMTWSRKYQFLAFRLAMRWSPPSRSPSRSLTPSDPLRSRMAATPGSLFLSTWGYHQGNIASLSPIWRNIPCSSQDWWRMGGATIPCSQPELFQHLEHSIKFGAFKKIVWINTIQSVLSNQ